MVPKISFGAPVIAVCRQEFPETVFDVKLGVVEPERRIADFIKAGADIISVHPEATMQLGAAINMIQDGGRAAGVVLNPATGVCAVEHVLDSCKVTDNDQDSLCLVFHESWYWNYIHDSVTSIETP